MSRAINVHKFGYSKVISAVSVAQTVWSAGGDYQFPTEATICYVLSDLDKDNSGLSGAHTVTIEGLDSEYKLQQETLSLNGTATADTSLSYLRVFRAYVNTAGDHDRNEGKISIYQHQVAADILLAEIPSDAGQTLMAVYTTPYASGNDYIELGQVSVSYSGNVNRSNLTCTLETKGENGAWQTKEKFGLSSDNASVTISYPYPQNIPPKTDIKLQVVEAAGAAEVGGTFDLKVTRNRTND